MRTIDRIKADPRVADVSDERDTGDGYWVYLKPGWRWADDYVHIIHEDTPAECLRELRAIIPCRCHECVVGDEEVQ